MTSRTYKLWTAADDARMRAEFPHTRTETLAQAMDRSLNSVRSRAVFLGLQKTPEALRTISRERMTSAFNAGCFSKGAAPWNKGRRGEYNISHGAPLGAERVRDGYLFRKVRLDGPFWRRWAAVHVLLWETHRGPVPDGYVVAFIDGDREHLSIDNLRLISQADNLARHDAHAHGPDIFRLHVLRGRITRAIHKREKKA